MNKMEYVTIEDISRLIIVLTFCTVYRREIFYENQQT